MVKVKFFLISSPPAAKRCLDQVLWVRFLHLGEDVKVLMEAPGGKKNYFIFIFDFISGRLCREIIFG